MQDASGALGQLFVAGTHTPMYMGRLEVSCNACHARKYVWRDAAGAIMSREKLIFVWVPCS